MLIHDDIFVWEGWGGTLKLANGKCRLRIFDLKEMRHDGVAPLRPTVVIVNDVEGSPMSVRSCASHIATLVTRQFSIKPNRMIWVEYYPSTTYGVDGKKVIPEKFDAIEFQWFGDKAMHPKWRTLSPPLLNIVSGLIDDKQPPTTD